MPPDRCTSDKRGAGSSNRQRRVPGRRGGRGRAEASTTAGSHPGRAWLARSRRELRRLEARERRRGAEIRHRARTRLCRSSTIDRAACTMSALEALRDGLRRSDVYVAPSERYGDPRTSLLDAPAWKASRTDVCGSLSLPRRPDRSSSVSAPNSPPPTGAPSRPCTPTPAARGPPGRLQIEQLDGLPEPPSLLALRDQWRVYGRGVPARRPAGQRSSSSAAYSGRGSSSPTRRRRARAIAPAATTSRATKGIAAPSCANRSCVHPPQ